MFSAQDIRVYNRRVRLVPFIRLTSSIAIYLLRDAILSQKRFQHGRATSVMHPGSLCKS